MTTRRILASASRIDLDDKTLIERPAPGQAPSAFRIWGAGDTRTDNGVTVFSDRSAKLLMEEQAKRGNLYSIDYDHLSLSTNRPATAGQAAGWHRLETRDGQGGKELWACAVEWVGEAKDGLEATPPKWRYFSPAYYQDVETNEVTSYTNTALCINPATHNNNQLATRAAAQTTRKKATKMDQAAMLAALKAILDDANTDDDTKAKAQALYDALVAAVGGEAKAEEMMKAAADEAPSEDPKKTDTEEAPESKKEPIAAAKVATVSKTDSANASLALRLAALEAKMEKDEVAVLVRDNIGKKIPESLKSWASVQKLDTLKEFLKAAPLISGAPAVKAVAATRGSDAEIDAPETDSVANTIDKVLGSRSAPTKRGMDTKPSHGIVKINVMTPTEARRLAAVK
jgi:hypothetical protein